MTAARGSNGNMGGPEPLRGSISAGAIGLAAAVLALGGEPLRLLARYDRAALAAGELWRLITAHLVHLGWGHLLMNLAALVVLWALARPWFSGRDWIGVWLAAAVAIDAGLYFGEPDVDWYVGLSGVLHGLWAGVAVAGLRHRSATSMVLVLALMAKIAWEQLAGPVPLSQDTAGGTVIVAAHAYGALGGIAWMVPRLILTRLARRQL